MIDFTRKAHTARDYPEDQLKILDALFKRPGSMFCAYIDPPWKSTWTIETEAWFVGPGEYDSLWVKTDDLWDLEAQLLVIQIRRPEDGLTKFFLTPRGAEVALAKLL